MAGLTISNDAEFMSFGFFEVLMEFLNSKNNTPLGLGLGLEVTSSLFHFSANPYNFSVFKNDDYNAPFSTNASRIEDYLKCLKMTSLQLT